MEIEKERERAIERERARERVESVRERASEIHVKGEKLIERDRVT